MSDFTQIFILRVLIRNQQNIYKLNLLEMNVYNVYSVITTCVLSFTGPCGISPRVSAAEIPLEAGMILSDGEEMVGGGGIECCSVEYIFMFLALIKNKNQAIGMMKPPLAIWDKITLKLCLVEPGYYEDGKFGVRIENLVLVVKAETKVRIGTVVTVTV